MKQEKTHSKTPHPVDKYVGRRLRQRRSICGLSQKVVSEKIGVTFQQLQKYERGKNRIGSSRLYDFSVILGVPVSYFFEGVESWMHRHNLASPTEAIEQSDDTGYLVDRIDEKETMQLVRNYHNIKNEAARRRIFSLIRDIAVTK